jgi:TRAP-type C4-dicarboxylate transport system permease small subunit
MTTHNLPPALARLVKFITWSENTLLVLMLAAMVLLAATQIVLRNFMDTGIAGAEQVLRLLVLWVAFMGAVAASREGKHIHIDAVARWLPGRAKAWTGALADLFTFSICLVLAWQSVRYLLKSMETAEKAIGSFPVWMAASILPLAFSLIALRYGLRMRHHVRQGLGMEPLESGEPKPVEPNSGEPK